MSGLIAENIVCGYNATMIVHGVTVRADKGRISTIIGPNGAGKSTLLKAIVGLLPIRDGKVCVDGQNLSNLAAHQIGKFGVSFVPQTANVFPSLTAREHIKLVAGRYADKRTQTLRPLFPGIDKIFDRQAGQLSGGERQLVAMLRALAQDPAYVVLDEPSAALSPKAAGLVFDVVKAIADSGVGVLIVEQNIKQIVPMSDTVFVLRLGQNVFDAPGSKLFSDPRLQDAYLV